MYNSNWRLIMNTAHTASIAIFKGEFDYSAVSLSTNPIVPPELFEVSQRVIENKSCEIYRGTNGVYVISYSKSGPFPESAHVATKWLPVYIARLEKWSSGGIKKEEYEQFTLSKESQQEDNE